MSRVRTLIGFVLLVIGNVRLLEVLADNHVDVAFGDLLAWSPALLVIAGLIGLARLFGARQSYRGPVLLVGLGLMLLLITIRPLRSPWFEYAWPVAAIGVGWLLVSSARPKAEMAAENWPREVCVLDARYHISNATELRIGTIGVFLGGYTLDLRAAELGAGARIDVTAILGGVDVIVPRAWRVMLDKKEIFGACRDRTEVAPDAGDLGPAVTISALAMLGGVDIRHDF